MVEFNAHDNRPIHQIMVKPQFINNTVAPNAGTAATSEAPVDGNEESDQSAGFPVIEISTYSETDVYECYCRGMESKVLMRRVRDDWVNITQIFKVAKFSKAQRTKVLEKESMNMQHEKIQGGYGRFQGTWAPLFAAQAIVNKYKISDLVISTLLSFHPDPAKPPPRRSRNSVLRRASPGGLISSPSSYKKTPKRKKAEGSASTGKGKKIKQAMTNPSPLHNIAFKTPNRHSMDSGDAGSTMNSGRHRGSFTVPNSQNQPNIIMQSNRAGNSVNSDNMFSTTQKPLQFYPIPTNVRAGNSSNSNVASNGYQNSGMRTGSGNNAQNKRNNAGNHGGIAESIIPGSQQSLQIINETMSTIHPNTSIDKGGYDTKMHQAHIQSDHHIMGQGNDISNNGGYNFSAGSNLEMFSSNDNVTPLSSRSNSSHLTGNESYNNNDNTIETLDEDSYKETLLAVLATESPTEQTDQMLSKLYYPPQNFDINFLIDDQGHTALHWAVALANIPLIRLLLDLGANIGIYNNLGINCVTKAVFYNNCFNQKVFGEVLKLLKSCLITPDMNRRLPIHYLVELSVNPSKDQTVISYYIDVILDTLSKENHELLKSALDFQDNTGNTSLHLAALNLNVTLWNKLSSLGAAMDIINNNGETPVSILSKFNFVPPSNNSVRVTTQKGRKASIKADSVSGKNAELDPDGEMSIEEDHNTEDTATGLTDSKTEGMKSTPADKKLLDIHQDEKAAKHKTYMSPVTHENTEITDNIDSMLEDIGDLDSLVTSSVLKSKNSPTLQQSPVIYKKNISQLNNSIIIRSPMKSRTAISPPRSLHNAVLVHSSEASPIGRRLKIHKLLDELRKSSGSLSSTVVDTIDNLKRDISTTERMIKETEERIKLLNSQQDEVLTTLVDIKMEPLNLTSVQEGQEAVTNMEKEIETGKLACVQYTEKSQALQLATLVQNEEAALDSSAESSPKKSKTTLKPLVELTLLQLKRRSQIRRITQIKVELNSTEKLNKYRYLIGMTIDNIEGKLDAIESDLQANQ